MAIIKITDANNKEFTVDDAKIFDINGDIADGDSHNVSDAMRNRIRVQNDVEYLNAKGEVIDANQILKDSASGKVNIIALDVQVEATHSGKNHNYCIYYEDSMEKDAESFINPYNKPMLKNHDSYSEPLGRTRQAWFGPSKLTDERSSIHLVTRVTDKDAIEKFLDGRYSTVSIGGSMGTVTCNICGKTILKDGKFKFCGHWKGESYKDQLCYWGVRDIEYHEHSTVNTPADDFAQVVKVTVITDEDKENKDNNKEGVGDMGGANNTPNNSQSSNDQRDKLMAMIDELLGNATTQATDENTSTSAETQTQDETSTETVPEAKDNNNSEDLAKQLEDANQKIADLEQQLADANTAKEEAESKLADAERAKEEAIQDSVAMKDQCIELALANKTMIADQIIELETSQNKLEDEKASERHQELIGQSMKDLQETLDALKKNETSTSDSQQRQVPQVQNPTLANAGESNSVIVDSEGNEVSTEDSKSQKKVEDSNKKKSVDDYAKDIIKKISNR